MVRRVVFSLGLVLALDAASAGLLQPRATDLAAKYDGFTLILGPTRRLVYGGIRGTLHQLESQDRKLVERLRRELWSPVLEMVAADLDNDGQDEVVGFTQNNRLFVLNGTNLQDIWNTQEGRLRSIRALTVADVDEDGQAEILLVVDGQLRIFSGMRDILEWQSVQEYQDTDIAVGDVDGDGKLEIVLNSGLVLDALFRELEWKYDPGFGQEMDLYDVDNDGRLEIVGLGADGLLRVFDVDERRVKFD